MDKYYDINKLPKEPITFYIGTRKNKEQLANIYGVMLDSKNIKKKYHLKREIWITIAISIAFIGLMLIIAGIEMMVF